MKGFEGLLTSFESKDAQTLRKTEREQCEGAFCPTRFKDFKHMRRGMEEGLLEAGQRLLKAFTMPFQRHQASHPHICSTAPTFGTL